MVKSSEDKKEDVTKSMNGLKRHCHELAKEKGFWEEDRNDGELIALIHSELSEVLEALRHDNPRSKTITEFSEAEEEMADAMIRILDMCEAREWDIEGALWAKLNFNRKRPYKHNKNF